MFLFEYAEVVGPDELKLKGSIQFFKELEVYSRSLLSDTSLLFNIHHSKLFSVLKAQIFITQSYSSLKFL